MTRRSRLGLAILLIVVGGAGLVGILGRKQVREVAGIFAEHLVLFGLPEIDDATRSRLPNILLISVDTWRKSEIGLYNSSLATTPHLDRRSGEFIRFDHAISQAPWTGPAHLALFYSRQPPVPFWEGSVLSLTQILRHFGYETAAFTDGGWLGRGGGIDAGFDQLTSPAGGTYHQPLAEKLAQVTSWLDEGPEGPFFLFVHTYHAHADYDPTPEYLEPFFEGAYDGRFTGDIDELLEVNQLRLAGKEVPGITTSDVEYVRALYRAEIREVDEFLERLFADLESRDLWNDMLVIVTSDHGESFFERGFFEHGTGLYDELLNVPLMVKPPEGFTRAPSPVTTQVELLDLPPTILDMIGIAPPNFLEGKSFLSLLSGQPNASYDKHYARSAVAETSNYGDAKQSIRTGEWKYILHPASGREELYRLTTDPDERHDVAEAHPDVIAGFRQFLQSPDRIEHLESPTAPNVSPEDREILKALGYIE